VLFAALGLYALTKWVENEKIGYYTLAAFALALSILLKLTSLYVGIPVLFLFWMKYRSRWWRMPLVWLFAALVPIGIDWSLGVFGIWANTFTSRTITGLILGIACATFLMPAAVEITRNLTISSKIKKAA